MKWLISLTIWLLERSDLSSQARARLTTAVLDRLFALPFRDIITSKNGSFEINGRNPTFEELKQLRDSAKTVLLNPAWKLIQDQVAFRAITVGIHQAVVTDQLQFAKSALWWGQQEQQLLALLAGTETEE